MNKFLINRIKYSKLFISILLLLLCSLVSWCQSTTKFNDGYLSVFKVSSTASLASTATGIVMEEYVNTGTSQSSPNFSVNMPTSGTNTVLVSGTATSAGAITRSENGRYLIVPGYNATLSAANSTFTTNSTLRLVNATGTISSGVQAGGTTTTTFYSNGSNNVRGGLSDDGTNFWGVGNGTGSSGTNGLQTCAFSSGVITGITNVTASQNLRVGKIINSQIFVSTQTTFGTVGTGKPTSSATFSSLFTLNATNTSAYSFDVSPDFLTVYITDDGASKGVYRYTYSGTYSGGTWSGGTWSGGSLITSISGCIGLTVDWSGYSFNASSANGAKLYYCIPLILYTASDNGTTVVSPTTLRTISGNNAFRGLAFSPINQTISKGANTPATGNITKGSSNTVLFQMNLSADEGNSTLKKIVLATSGTAVLGTDISNFRIVDDANNDGVAGASEISASFTTTGTVTGSNISFSSLLLSSYINQGSSKNFLIIGDVAANATAARTFIPSIASTNTINSISYTSNITNAGGSLVTMGTSTDAPTGNTLTIIAPSTTNVTLATTGTPSSANLGTGSGKLIYGFSLTPSGGSVNFTALNITTSGTATSSDISTFDLYYDADASGTINSGDVLVKTVSTLANPLAFSSFTNAQTGLADGTTYRYLVQATVAGTATNGRTITLSIASTSDITTNATGSVSGTPSGNVMYVGNPSSTTTNSGTPAASNAAKAATDFLVFGFQLTPTGLVDFTAVNIATAGTATSSDISNFRLYKDVDASGTVNGGDVLVQTVSTLANPLAFSSLAQTGLTAATKYLVIANIASGATTGRTFTASIAANGDVYLTSVLVSNTGTAAGNQMTIDAGTFGDFRSNGTGGGVWSSTSTWQTYSATGTWVAASVAPTSATYVTKDVTILSGDVVTVTGTSNYCKNLTVQGSGGKLFSNQVATTTFINVYGDITCNGTIGNGSTYDAIGFDVEGSSCTISGSGTFDAARIAKNSITSPAATTTTLTFDMNANLRYGGTGSGSQSSNNTELYNNVAGSIFNIVINSSKTLTCIGDGIATSSAAAVSIDGTDGAGSGERGGSLTVNGTLDIQYNGTPAGTSPTYGLYLTTNNTTSAVSVSIGASGIINTPRIVCSASGAAGHTFSISSGGVLNITQLPTSFITPSNTNNTYTFDANSNINYNKAGAQTIYTFGPTVYQGNITLSGSGVKSVPSTGILNVNGTLTTGGLLTLLSNASGTASIGALTTGSVSGNVKVERYIPQNSNRAWRTLAVPTYGAQTIFNAWQQGTIITGPASCTGMDVTTNGYSMYSYNASTDNLVGVSNTTTTAINANTAYPQTYFLYVRGDRNTGIANSNANPGATTLSTTGSIYQGTVSTDISANNGAATTYHLIGNPYVSPININSFLNNANNANNIENYIYVWDPKMTNTANGVGGILTLTSNGSGYDPTTTGLSYSNGTTELPSGMAFFVQKTSSNCTNCTVNFTESMKSTGAISSNGFKTASQLDGKMQINLAVKINDSTEGVADGLLAIYDAAADAQVVASEDAAKMNNFGESMSIKNGTALLAVEKRPLNNIDTLFINTEGLTNRNYRLVFNPSQFDPSVKAQLIDHYQNLTYPVAIQQKTVYDFTIDANAASKASARFELRYSNSSLGIGNTSNIETVSVYPNPTRDAQVFIAMHNQAAGIYQVQIVNAMGITVQQYDMHYEKGMRPMVDLSNAAKGVYYLKLSNAQKEQVVVKIINL